MIDHPRNGQRVLVRTAANQLERAEVARAGVDRRGRFPTVWVRLPADPTHAAQPWPIEDVFSDLGQARRRVDKFTRLARVIPFRSKEATHG